MADDKQNYTKTGIDQSHDIVTRLRTGRPSAVYDIAQHAADEIERLQAIVAIVDDLHSPRLAHDTCLACYRDWPCPTHLLIHPETRP